MADPNSSAVGTDTGTLAPADPSQLTTEVAQIHADFAPQVQAAEQQEQATGGRAVEAQEDVSLEAARQAGELSQVDPEIQKWVDSTPTRQAVYASSMHAAPVLAILMAIGGKVTKQSGQTMLAAQTGMVQGLNEGSEKKYNDAVEKWKAGFQALQDHQARMMEAHRLMLTAYQGRADAYQKAAEAARRMTGDILDKEQRKVSETTDLWKAQSEGWYRLQKVNQANRALAEKVKGSSDQSPQGWSQENIDYYARQQLAGDMTWRVGLSRTKEGSQIIRAVDKRVPELAKMSGLTPEAASTTKDIRKSIDSALTDRQKYVAAGTQFVANFQKQADLVEKYLAPGVGGSAPVFNRWIQAGRKSVEGDADVTNLDTAIRGLAREHQRIVTGVTSNSQLHVQAQETADELLNRNMTEAQIRGTMKVMREEADNAVQSGKEEIGHLQLQLKQLGVAGAQSNGAAPPGAQPVSTGFSQSTNQWYIRYSDGSVKPAGPTRPTGIPSTQ
jgi:hypothetical protein